MPAVPCGTCLRLLAAAAIACAAAAAAAHDTWLQAHGAPGEGLLALSVSTGTHFPVAESAPSMRGLAFSGCIDAQGRSRELRPREAQPTALLLRTRADPASAISCWVQTRPQSVTLSPEDVERYLRDIQAPPETRARWLAQRAQGVAWRESFVKQARIEHADAGSSGLAALRAPVGQGLELRLAGEAAVRIGEPLRVQVLLDGQPLEGLAVQLVGDTLPLGPWRRSDARGELEFPAPPLAGRWLLRTTRLEPPATPGGEWRSRFATLMVFAR